MFELWEASCESRGTRATTVSKDKLLPVTGLTDAANAARATWPKQVVPPGSLPSATV